MRYDDNHAWITYNGSGWSDNTSFTGSLGRSVKVNVSPTDNDTITFKFKGTSLKTYGCGYAGMNTGNKIIIDGKEHNMVLWDEIPNNTVGVSFEITGLENVIHDVGIVKNDSARMYFDGFETDGFISKNGIVDVTPIMTSDTTPAPYVVSASSLYNSGGYPAWKAFNGVNTNNMTDTWAGSVATSAIPQWIKIDMSEKVTMNKYQIVTRNYDSGNPPKTWILQGSNDDVEWVDIDSRQGEFMNYSKNETREYPCKESSYRYYRLFITETNGGTFVCIGEFRLLYDDNKVIAQTPLSINKTLKENLPIKTDRDELHFTEDGGIYINDKDGNLVQCKTGNFVMDVSNPLTTNPLEYATFRMSQDQTTDLDVDSVIKFDTMSDGNMISIEDNMISLKANKTYRFSMGILAQSTRLDAELVDAETGEAIGLKVSCIPVSGSNGFNPVSNSECFFTPTKDCKVYMKIIMSTNTTTIWKSYTYLNIQEVRNNPVNQYGGFQTEVLFDGDASEGEYELNGNINDYDILNISSTSTMIIDTVSKVPNMTSNTVPSPFVVSASAIYNSTFEAYKAFDSDDTVSEWACNGNSGWIKIDMGEETLVNAFKIATRQSASSGQGRPSTVLIEGSNDDVDYVEIKSDGVRWSSKEIREYLTKEQNFRYYRFSFTSIDGMIVIANIGLHLVDDNNIIRNETSIFVDKNIINGVNNEKHQVRFNGNVMNISKVTEPINRIIGIKGQLPSLLVGGEF